MITTVVNALRRRADDVTDKGGVLYSWVGLLPKSDHIFGDGFKHNVVVSHYSPAGSLLGEEASGVAKTLVSAIVAVCPALVRRIGGAP